MGPETRHVHFLSVVVNYGVLLIKQQVQVLADESTVLGHFADERVVELVSLLGVHIPSIGRILPEVSR